MKRKYCILLVLCLIGCNKPVSIEMLYIQNQSKLKDILEFMPESGTFGLNQSDEDWRWFYFEDGDDHAKNPIARSADGEWLIDKLPEDKRKVGKMISELRSLGHMKFVICTSYDFEKHVEISADRQVIVRIAKPEFGDPINTNSGYSRIDSLAFRYRTDWY